MVVNTINQVFESQVNSKVKQYGSQESGLAIDSSDVDLAVTGLNLGDKENQLF